MSSDLWVWLSALITIGAYSVLYRDNPVYKSIESLFVGLSAGYIAVANFHNYIKPTVTQKVINQGHYALLIPIILGLLMYTRYVKSVSWLSRYSNAFLLGIGSAYVLVMDFKPLFLTQARATMGSLIASNGSTGVTLNNIIVFLGVVCSISYFLFTVKRTGPIGYATKFGRLILMISFGAAFGNTVMGRVSVTFGRFNFLLKDWLGMIK